MYIMINEAIKEKLDNFFDKEVEEGENIIRVDKKKDGLVERVKSSKIVLTEDNKQVLFG